MYVYQSRIKLTLAIFPVYRVEGRGMCAVQGGQWPVAILYTDYMVWYGMVRYCMVWYGILWYGMILYGTLQDLYAALGL